MKIILINDRYPPEITGVGNYVYSLARKMDNYGHQIVILTTTQDKKSVGKFIEKRVIIYKLYSKFHRYLKNYFVIYNPLVIGDIKRILKKEKPDICHFFNVHERISYYALKIASKYSQATFWHARDVMSFSYRKLTHFIKSSSNLKNIKKEDYKLSFFQLFKQSRKGFNPWRNFFIRHYLKYPDKLFSVSQSLKDAMQINGIKGDIKVLRSGIDVADFEPLDKELKEFKDKYNLYNKKVLFLGGRLGPEKGVKQAVLALKEVLKRNQKVILFLAGKKLGYSEGIMEFAKKNNISNNIIISGWLNREDLKKIIYISDIVLNPSLCLDAFPKINLEAMAAKKPVIGTCFGGTPEIVINGETGYIINPLNVNKMSEKILELLYNHKKAKKLGESGYRIVINNFNLDKITKEILDYY